MNINELPAALLGFFEKEIMPNIPSTFAQWVAFFIGAAGAPILNAEIAKYIPIMQQAGIVSSDGTLDLDKAEEFGIQAFKKVPVINLLNMGLEEQDFRRFIAFCRQCQHPHQTSQQTTTSF